MGSLVVVTSRIEFPTSNSLIEFPTKLSKCVHTRVEISSKLDAVDGKLHYNDIDRNRLWTRTRAPAGDKYVKNDRDRR